MQTEAYNKNNSWLYVGKNKKKPVNKTKINEMCVYTILKMRY